MATVTLTWTLPQVTAARRPIASTTVEFRVQGIAQWTVQEVVPAAANQSVVFTDVAPGTYEYRAQVEDVDGQVGPYATTSVVVPFEAPGAPVNLAAAVS